MEGIKKENDLERDKEFSLQIKDGDSYRPMTMHEFHKFASRNPELAKYFFDEQEINTIPVPKIDENAQIFYHWEKAAIRVL